MIEIERNESNFNIETLDYNLDNEIEELPEWRHITF